MNILYCPNKIEKDVQEYWYKNQTFSVKEEKNREKYYCLSMMPYPSGNLHMGHVRNYTIGDVISRYQRMLGKNVLHPMGWDAFGLPAEQAAISNNIAPSTWTYQNIRYMKNQLKSLGFSYDWNRELITCKSKYYRWEQWFFTVLYKKGLVYKKTALVNWCPYHKTVLANEQVINNCCWRCNTLVKYKKVPQWFIKITDYADQLLDGLNYLEHWPETVKNMQRNWIGRSQGMNIFFNIKNSKDTITVYTKNLDIFMGITYLVISIDHPIALKAANSDFQLSEFIKKNNDFYSAPNKHHMLSSQKQGISINLNAIHPINNNNLPIWVANFVTRMELNGIGAEVAIPAHDQKDLEFARYYNLPIKPVLKNLNGTIPIITTKSITNKTGILCNSGKFDGLTVNIAYKMISKALINKGVATHQTNYRLQDWGISRQRYWGVPIPMTTIPNTNIICPIPIDQLPVILPEDIYVNRKINNAYKKEITWRDTDTFDTFMESSWYYARYTCPHYHEGMLDSQAANYWLPIDQYVGGIEHAIMHLMYFRFYHKLMRDEGLVSSDEPAIRLLCQGMVLSDAFYYFSDDGQRIWIPSEKVNVQKDKSGRIIKATDLNGRNVVYAGMCKMSKSKNNGVDPNEMIKKYGADSVRFFIMFAAPSEAALEWTISGLKGAHRFLNRVWKLVHCHVQKGLVDILCTTNLNKYQKNIQFCVYKTVEKVTDDIARRQKFNTALAEIMKLVNILYNIPQLNAQNRAVLQEALLIVVQLLYPFTPHISFVLWKLLGQSTDIDYVAWPTVKLTNIKKTTVLLIIQINGKMKHKIFVPLNSDKKSICQLIQKETVLNKYLIQKTINDIIYIPNKVINIII